ncbi:MAG: hypothetical protein IPF66_21075 [Holophagales bacterium]|nr:hypothetical protein [Holophagales bacterium]
MTEPLESAARVLDRPLEVPRRGRAGEECELGPVAARGAGSEPFEPAELLDDPRGGGRVRALLERQHRARDLGEPVVEPDGLPPVEAEQAAVGQRKDLGQRAERRGPDEAPGSVENLGDGDRLTPVLAVRGRSRPDRDAHDSLGDAQDEPRAPFAAGFERVGNDDRIPGCEARRRLAPRAGEEHRGPSRPDEDAWGRGVSHAAPDIRDRERREGRLSVRSDADDAERAVLAPQDPGLVAEERRLGAAQRGRRHGGADPAVGEPEDETRLHLPLLTPAGEPAAEAVGGRRGDASARVGHAQDVPLVAEREDGPFRAFRVAQDEPAGQRFHRPDQPPWRHAERRLEAAPRRRRRGRAERLDGEEACRAEAQGGEGAGAERSERGRHGWITA